MEQNQTPQMREEQAYLRRTIEYLDRAATKDEDAAGTEKRRLTVWREALNDEIAARTDDLERRADANQYYQEDASRMASVQQGLMRADRYRQMKPSPYFGRFDFAEAGDEPEKIYVGRHTLMDEASGDIYVYDWRAPVCEIFYQYGPGEASYRAPGGAVRGRVDLKRQFRIEKSRLLYFFDSGVVVGDPILQDVLGRHAAPAMRSIVESIARDQDGIIRDDGSGLLMVQGPAGSGKTVVALHRVAWLLYRGVRQGLTSRDIVALTPSDVFGRYIEGVLPELGEQNVRETTFSDLAASLLGVPAEGAGAFAESADADSTGLRQEAYRFKNSAEFGLILDRALCRYERRGIPFGDVWYAGSLVADAEELRGMYRHDTGKLPPAGRLGRLRTAVLERVRLLEKPYHRRLEGIIREWEGHDYDYRTQARRLAIREARRMRRELERSTRLQAADVYAALFEGNRLRRLARGIPLPARLDEILSLTRRQLAGGTAAFDDQAPLMYLKLGIDGRSEYDGIRQAVVDEAQEYAPLQYAVMGRLFPHAMFTLLGDTGQAVLGAGVPPFTESAPAAIRRAHPQRLELHRSYRSTWEIARFAARMLPDGGTVEPFERHGEEPAVVECADDAAQEAAIIRFLAPYAGGDAGTAAVVCRTEAQAQALAERLRGRLAITYVGDGAAIRPGCMAMAAFRARGLEFDAVCVADCGRFDTPMGRRLLYIACTRALHRLMLCCRGKRPAFLPANGCKTEDGRNQ